MIKTFKSNINIDDGYRNTSIGEKISTMELYEGEDYCNIEWIVNDGEFVENIGIFCEENSKTVRDYDGVFEVPKEAIELLKENGYDVTYLLD